MAVGGRCSRGLPRGAQVLAYVNRVLDIGSQVDHDAFTLEQVESNAVRCPDSAAADRMYTGAPQAPPPSCARSGPCVTSSCVTLRSLCDTLMCTLQSMCDTLLCTLRSMGDTPSARSSCSVCCSWCMISLGYDCVMGGVAAMHHPSTGDQCL